MNRYDTSWTGDRAARLIELEEILADLKQTKPTGLTEYGCGPFTLDELPELEAHLPNIFCYFGVDVSPTALANAMHYTARMFDQGGLIWCDLNQKFWTPDLDTGSMFGLSRRTLQNLTSRATQQSSVCHMLNQFPHGLIIERTTLDWHNVNRARAALGKSSLPVPRHNLYLTSTLMDHLCKIGWVEITYPMTHYFYQTRVVESRPKGAPYEKGCRCGLPDMGPAFIRW